MERVIVKRAARIVFKINTSKVITLMYFRNDGNLAIPFPGYGKVPN